METPRLTNHARQRCAEMGISTKVAKAIVRRPSVTRPSGNRRIAVNDASPDYAVVYDPVPTPVVIVSVVFRTVADYERNGETFVAKDKG